MDILTAGMQNLRIAEFFYEGRQLNEADRERLRRGLDFVNRILAAVLFLGEGLTEGLEESSFAEARYASNTVVRLKKVLNLPEAKSYLTTLRQRLDDYIDNGVTLNESEREELASFFSDTGESMISDVIDFVQPDPDGRKSNGTSALELQ